MAGSKLTLNTKARASTLLEVVIALVIIILVFGTAMMIYINVLSLSLSAKKIKAQALLEETLLKEEQTNDYTGPVVQTGEYRIEQELKPFQTDTLLNVITLTAFDANRQSITQIQKVIRK